MRNVLKQQTDNFTKEAIKNRAEDVKQVLEDRINDADGKGLVEYGSVGRETSNRSTDEVVIRIRFKQKKNIERRMIRSLRHGLNWQLRMLGREL